MHLPTLSVLGVLAACSYAAPYPASHTLHEKRHTSSSPWVKRDRIPADALLPMRIGLTQRNLEKGYDFLMDV